VAGIDEVKVVFQNAFYQLEIHQIFLAKGLNTPVQKNQQIYQFPMLFP